MELSTPALKSLVEKLSDYLSKETVKVVEMAEAKEEVREMVEAEEI